ncbi:hypothetical protein GCM10009613_17630 [Pseudonocardia kongjuensis]|uniref:Uncharacterized protein n=1 Tax=Pseudonocardia kongjuensis TaxID=102227 RepID=A0ABN1XM84_9PSEU
MQVDHGEPGLPERCACVQQDRGGLTGRGQHGGGLRSAGQIVGEYEDGLVHGTSVTGWSVSARRAAPMLLIMHQSRAIREANLRVVRIQHV